MLLLLGKYVKWNISILYCTTVQVPVLVIITLSYLIWVIRIDDIDDGALTIDNMPNIKYQSQLDQIVVSHMQYDSVQWQYIVNTVNVLIGLPVSFKKKIFFGIGFVFVVFGCSNGGPVWVPTHPQ